MREGEVEGAELDAGGDNFKKTTLGGEPVSISATSGYNSGSIS